MCSDFELAPTFDNSPWSRLTFQSSTLYQPTHYHAPSIVVILFVRTKSPYRMQWAGGGEAVSAAKVGGGGKPRQGAL